VPSYRAWCWKLSKLLGGMQFFLPDYTLSPEVTFPVALQQCWKAYLWILDPKVPTTRHDTTRHTTRAVDTDICVVREVAFLRTV
jgi:hypothetical protein